MTLQRLRMRIVGGSIGSFTLASALRKRGLETEAFEQASELTEIGAAFTDPTEIILLIGTENQDGGRIPLEAA